MTYDYSDIDDDKLRNIIDKSDDYEVRRSGRSELRRRKKKRDDVIISSSSPASSQYGGSANNIQAKVQADTDCSIGLIKDELELKKLLEQCTHYQQRVKIRNAIRELRDENLNSNNMKPMNNGLILNNRIEACKPVRSSSFGGKDKILRDKVNTDRVVLRSIGQRSKTSHYNHQNGAGTDSNSPRPTSMIASDTSWLRRSFHESPPSQQQSQSSASSLSNRLPRYMRDAKVVSMYSAQTPSDYSTSDYSSSRQSLTDDLAELESRMEQCKHTPVAALLSEEITKVKNILNKEKNALDYTSTTTTTTTVITNDKRTSPATTPTSRPDLSVPRHPPTEVSLREDAELSLRFTIEGACALSTSVRWTRDHIDVSEHMIQNFCGETAELLCKELRMADAGTYRCVITREEQICKTETVVLVRAKPCKPYFAQELKDEEINIGETSVTLKCHLCGHPKPRITWFHNTVLLSPYTGVQQYEDGVASLSLTSNDLDGDDITGNYQCSARNISGEVRTIANISRVQEVKDLYELKFIQVLQDQCVDDGDDVIISCTITSSSPDDITFKWFKDDIELKESSDISIEDEKVTQGRRLTLSLDDTTPESSGTYRCEVTVAHSTIDTVASLSVQEIIRKRRPSHITMVNKPSASLVTMVSSEAESSPTSRVTPTITISPTDDDDVDSTTSTSPLTSECCSPDEFTTPPEYESDPTTDSQSECSVTAQNRNVEEETSVREDIRHLPPTESKVGGDTANDKTTPITSATPPTTTPTITPASTPTTPSSTSPTITTARTTSEVDNKSSHPTTISADDATDDELDGAVASKHCTMASFSVPLKDALRFAHSSEVILECEFKGHPVPDIIWYRNRQPISTSDVFTIVTKRGKTSMNIKSLTPSTSGIYKCVAKNNLGIARTCCSISIQDARESRDQRMERRNVERNEDRIKIHDKVSPAVMATETINSVSAGIEEEELLYKKLSETEDFNERRMIRSKLKEIRLQKTSDWNKSKEIRDSLKTDANQLRQEQSKQQKLRKMESFDKLAKENREKGQTTAELAFRERQKKNEAEKQRKLDEYKEIGKVMSKAYHQGSEIAAQNSINVGNRNKEMKMQGFEDQQTSRNVEHGMDGSVTTTTTSSSSSRDGNRTTIKQSKNVTTIGGVGGTSYGLNKSADEIAREICDRFTNGTGGGGGVVIGGEVGVTIRRTPIVPEGVAQRAVKARSWGACRSGAMAAFKQMDSSNNGSARPNYLGGGKGVQRSASTVKAMLLEWVKQMVKGYDNVDVTNFSTSWNNGMAFCALIHRFFPKSFEYAKLNPKNRRFNFTLAFEVAEKFAGISPLLDVEDMVRMKNPDWKCVFTTVQVYYRWFKSEENKSPGTPGQPISPLVTSEVKIES